MKRKMLTLVGTLSLFVAAASAHAQTIKVKGTIPFDFIVNRAILPAGQYMIESLGSVDGRTLLIRSSDMKPKASVNAFSLQSLNTCERTKLVFHRYGDRYFLAEIWVAGNSSGHELPKSPREVEVAKDFTMQEVLLMAALH